MFHCGSAGGRRLFKMFFRYENYILFQNNKWILGENPDAGHLDFFFSQLKNLILKNGKDLFLHLKSAFFGSYLTNSTKTHP